MPRPNRGRSIGGEANLAERIRYEREAEGWSPAELARRMTESGCTITTSAIYKIEAGARTIKVDELIALSKVFDLPVENLLMPMELLKQEAAQQLLKELWEAEEELLQAMAALFDRQRRYFTLAAAGEDEMVEFMDHLRDSLNAGLSETTGSWHWEGHLDDPRFLFDAAPVEQAWRDLVLRLMEIAAAAVEDYSKRLEQLEGAADGKH